MTRTSAGLIAILFVLGAGWGMTQPLSKIAVSDGYRHFGLVFWQLAIGAGLMFCLQTIRRRRLRLRPEHLKVYAIIALIGTVFPNSAAFEAMRHLPSGIISILLSLVPMMAFPLALMMGTDRFTWPRLAGLILGLCGVALLVVPEASLPQRAMIAFLPLALVAPFFYAFEGNYVAKWGTAGLDPVEVLYGASLLGAVVTLPLAIWSGQWIDPRPPWGAPDFALVLSSSIHVAVYAAYVWMVGRAGPVFAVQVSYLVTCFGILWAILLLGESYSGWIWISLVLIFAGVFLVQPRRAVADGQNPREDAP